MPRLNLEPTAKEIAEGERSLAGNEYPGRVIIMGLNSPGDLAIQAYAITGRSEGSRNRILIPEPASSNEGYIVGVRTVPSHMTHEHLSEVENAALIYYKAMDEMDGLYVVTNGAQTQPVLDVLVDRADYDHNTIDLETAVRSAPTLSGVNLSSYEPDAPNFTPRISGAFFEGPRRSSFDLSIVRRGSGDRAVYATYKGRDLRKLSRGVGYAIQTYAGNGDPLPAFDREPYPFPIGENAEETAHKIWDVLNKDNRVAVAVRSADIYSGTEYHIINARGPETHITN